MTVENDGMVIIWDLPGGPWQLEKLRRCELFDALPWPNYLGPTFPRRHAKGPASACIRTLVQVRNDITIALTMLKSTTMMRVRNHLATLLLTVHTISIRIFCRKRLFLTVQCTILKRRASLIRSILADGAHLRERGRRHLYRRDIKNFLTDNLGSTFQSTIDRPIAARLQAWPYPIIRRYGRWTARFFSTPAPYPFFCVTTIVIHLLGFL